MPNNLIHMSKVKSIIKLYTQGVSKSSISARLSLPRNSVKKYIQLFLASNLSITDIDNMSDTDLEQMFLSMSSRFHLENDPRFQSMVSFFPKMRDVLPRRFERGAHLVEDVQAAAARLVERFPHDVGGDAADLDVHLQRGDAGGGARHLEVHVAVVIFRAGDVGEHDVFAGFLVHYEPHRDSGHRVGERHAGVHHRERAAADGGHRRGAVRLENVGHDAYGVGKLFF